jgi:MFS family permease
MPLFLQIVTGASATSSGLLLLPLMLGITVTSIGSGRIMTRTGRYKIFPVAGLALMTVGLFALSRMDATTSRVTTSLWMVVFGLGFGMVSQVLIVAIQNTVDRRELGTVTAAANFFRALGGSIGVAIFGALFTNRVHYWLPRQVPAHLLRRVNPNLLQASPGTIRALPAAVRDGVVQVYAHSVTTVFLVAVPIAALGFLVVLFLKENPLREAPGVGKDVTRARAG